MVSTFHKPFTARDGAEASPLQTSPAGRQLTLVFADDFHTFRRWTGESGIWSTSQGEGFRPAQGRGDTLRLAAGPIIGNDAFSLERGILEITAQKAAMERVGAKYPYVSGLISTEPSFSQTYGYFEMRAELPQGKGLWPAFWMLPKDGGWPPEIDIVESIGDPGHVYMTAHSKFGKAHGIEANITPNVFHTFAVSWDRHELIWYIDGTETGRMRTPDDMHKPMYLLANLAVGGRWPGAPDATTRFPAKLMIDYIRAYRFET